MKKIMILLLASLVLITGCSKDAEYELNSQQVTDKIEAGDSFMLYISSSSCSACQIFTPVYKEVKAEYDEYLFMLDYAKQRNEDEESLEKLLSDYLGNINATPTVLIIKDKEVVQSFVGIMKYSEIENALINYNVIE